MPPITITAQGTSTIYRQAERAVITVQVSSTGESQEQVSKDVVSTANDLRAMLKSLAPKTEQGDATPDAAVTHWKNNTLTTSSYERHDKDGNKLGRQYSARTRFEIKVRDFERLGSLATSLATMPHVAVNNIEWRLTDATTASLGTQSRQDAVRDAVGRASDYTAALGRGAPQAMEVVDGDKGLSNIHPMAAGPRRRFLPGGGGDHQGQEQGEMLDLEPESVRLISTVTIKFTAD